MLTPHPKRLPPQSVHSLSTTIISVSNQVRRHRLRQRPQQVSVLPLPRQRPSQVENKYFRNFQRGIPPSIWHQWPSHMSSLVVHLLSFFVILPSKLHSFSLPPMHDIAATTHAVLTPCLRSSACVYNSYQAQMICFDGDSSAKIRFATWALTPGMYLAGVSIQ